jgi:hypothetical protein
MINFFRKIRKKLADDNKPLKYMRYAIGEIVLVVVGILIALQINNWNEKGKNDNIIQQYITNLKIDLTSDIENLEALDSLNTFYETEGSYLDKYLIGKLHEIDTVRITNAIVIVAYIPNMTIISSTYNDLMNSNNIVLFKDVELKKLLDSYYIPNEWVRLFNDRILDTAWDKYKSEMLEYHSTEIYKDYYLGEHVSLKAYKPLYDIKWDEMKNNEFLKTQVGMLEHIE